MIHILGILLGLGLMLLGKYQKKKERQQQEWERAIAAWDEVWDTGDMIIKLNETNNIAEINVDEEVVTHRWERVEDGIVIYTAKINESEIERPLWIIQNGELYFRNREEEVVSIKIERVK